MYLFDFAAIKLEFSIIKILLFFLTECFLADVTGTSPDTMHNSLNLVTAKSLYFDIVTEYHFNGHIQSSTSELDQFSWISVKKFRKIMYG
jgi:hypothetical protein